MDIWVFQSPGTAPRAFQKLCNSIPSVDDTRIWTSSVQILSQIHDFCSELVTGKGSILISHCKDKKWVHIYAGWFVCLFVCLTSVFESSPILHSIPLNVKIIIVHVGKWLLLQNNCTLNAWIANVCIMNFSCIRVPADNLCYRLDVFHFQIVDFHILFYHISLFSISVFMISAVV